MKTVYFSKNIDPILERMDLDSLGKRVAIKVHFGERGCNTYMDPAIVHMVYDRIVASGREAALVECNVLYKGSRTRASEHIATAKEHGFERPIDILDGEDGKEQIEVDGCLLGKGLERYDSLVVVSHFKGHMGAGFGAALKNVGMGLGSRAGKLDMHAATKPSINDKCIACGICVRNCDVAAIGISGGKAHIDPAICIGCAMCIAVCPHSAVEVPWQGRTHEELQKRIAEYSKAVLSLFPDALYLNLLANITAHCDCMGMAQKPMMSDIGFMYGDDIVAIDRASLEMADEVSGGAFSQVNKIDKRKQLQLAEEIGLGDGAYELVKIG